MSLDLFRTKPLAELLREGEGGGRLRRVLGRGQLTALGVGSIIGTGIFVLIGEAARDRAGPAITVSFAVAGVACTFAALCYAELASMVPVAGSVYTYAYATLGEVVAWVIGWDLVLEYAVGAATVAHGWSAHLQRFLPAVGLGRLLPRVLAEGPVAYRVAGGPGGPFAVTGAWVDLPAVLVTAAVTVVLVRGIRGSAAVNATLVVIKLAVVIGVIAVGAFYVKKANWHPFAPFGYGGLSVFGHPLFGHAAPTGGPPLGMLAGAGIVFFSYIGFDSVSVHSEEAVEPARDVPVGIIASLVISTALYLGVAVVLTGMVPRDQIDPDAAVAAAFRRAGLHWMEYLVAAGAVTGITSVLLVLMLSQPRVLLAMARDGLLPPRFFGDVHPRYQTPWKATILTGCFVATLAGLLPLSLLAEMTNIGTLFAFAIVCCAVPVLRHTQPDAERRFRVPFGLTFPILGVVSCLTLMLSLPAQNWWRLLIWLAVGLTVYFAYGRRRSRLARAGDKS